MKNKKQQLIVVFFLLFIPIYSYAEAALADLPFMLVEASSWATYEWLKKNIINICIISTLISVVYYFVCHLDKTNAGMQSSPVVLRGIRILKNGVWIFTAVSVVMSAILNVTFQKRVGEEKMRCETEDFAKCYPGKAAKIEAELAALEGVENIAARPFVSEAVIAERTWKRFAPNQKPWPKHTSVLDLPEGGRSGDRTILVMNYADYPLYVKLLYKTGDSRHWYVSSKGSMVFEQVPAGEYVIHVLHLGPEKVATTSEFTFKLEEAEFKNKHLEFSVYPSIDSGTWRAIKLEEF